MLIVIPGRGGRYRIYPLSGYHVLHEEEDIMCRMFFRPMLVLADVGDDYRSWLQRTVYVFLFFFLGGGTSRRKYIIPQPNQTLGLDMR